MVRGIRAFAAATILVALAAPAVADPAPARIDEPRLAVVVGASAFADGTLRGTPASVSVGTAVRGQALWWNLTAAYGPTSVIDGASGRGGELRTGPRVIRCSMSGWLCGGASAELGWGWESHMATSTRQDLVVDTRVHLLIGFDRATRYGVDLDLGVRGRLPISDAGDDMVGATPGVVAGVSLFARFGW